MSAMLMAQSLRVEEIVRDQSRYLNQEVTVRGIVRSAGQSDDQFVGKNQIVIADGASTVTIYTNKTFEELPKKDEMFETTGVLTLNGGLLRIQEKGGFDWLMVALVALGVVAVGLVAILMRSGKRPNRSEGEIGETQLGLPQVACVGCGQMISATDRFCIHCSADQRQPQVTSTPVVPTSHMSVGVGGGTATKTQVQPDAGPTMLELLVGNLYIKEGAGKGKFHPIGGKPITMGREASNTIALGGENVSRVHAEIRVADGGVWLEDKESTNGTLVNGSRITRHDLQHGDEISIGSNVLVFEKR